MRSLFFLSLLFVSVSVFSDNDYDKFEAKKIIKTVNQTAKNETCPNAEKLGNPPIFKVA